MHSCFGRNMHKYLTFSTFIASKILTIFFTKRDLVVFQNKAFLLLKFVYFNFSITKLCNFHPFLYMALNFFIIFLIYNFLLFSFKSVFKSAGSFLLLFIMFFFYTPQDFVFHFLIDFCIVHNCIASFSFSSLEKI